MRYHSFRKSQILAVVAFTCRILYFGTLIMSATLFEIKFTIILLISSLVGPGWLYNSFVTPRYPLEHFPSSFPSCFCLPFKTSPGNHCGQVPTFFKWVYTLLDYFFQLCCSQSSHNLMRNQRHHHGYELNGRFKDSAHWWKPCVFSLICSGAKRRPLPMEPVYLGVPFSKTEGGTVCWIWRSAINSILLIRKEIYFGCSMVVARLIR